jgi:hypothetical protein
MSIYKLIKRIHDHLFYTMYYQDYFPTVAPVSLGRAFFTVSSAISLELYSLLILLKLTLNNEYFSLICRTYNPVIYACIYFIPIVINYFMYIRNKKYIAIIGMYDNQSKREKTINNKILISYVLSLLLIVYMCSITNH